MTTLMTLQATCIGPKHAPVDPAARTHSVGEKNT